MKQTTLRRNPQQQRGVTRIEHILDAAEQIFMEVGCDAATTNAIAARAHTSIGSLYHFFPNKEAIIRGLTERYTQELHTLYLEIFRPEVAALPLYELMDRIIDPLVQFDLDHIAFKALFTGTQASLELAAATQAMDTELLQR